MIKVLKDILSSKKAVMALIAGATWGVGKLGLNVDSETMAGIVGPLVAYVLGQSYVDHAKELVKGQPPA
jgi:hypothetical protein